MSLKNLHIFLATAAAFYFLQFSVLAQDNQENNLKTDFSNRLYRPQIELGTGVMSYFGDVGHLGGNGRSYDLNWGYNLAVKNKISNAIDLNLFVLFGHVSQTEYFNAGNVNFKTDIKMGGLIMVYNFDNFLPKNRNISPYISLGFTSFEFNPKGDLFDANGNKYHYWNDGTIRRGPHTVAKDNSSDVLQRNYVYESDLRKLDDKKRYELRSFSVPIGAGAMLNLTDAFTLRMGAEFHYTLTDNIDNIDSRNTSYASSKKGNDYLLYSSLGIIYNMHYFKNDKTKPDRFNLYDMDEIEFEDEDNDGVADIVDLCPFTPAGVKVDMYGCPIDSDKDGVPDYLDLEPNSAPNAHVDENGVTLTDERIEQMYLAFKDSVGDMQLQKSRTVTADINLKRKEVGNYKLMIENSSDLTQDELSKMLSIPDLKYEYTNGELSYFTTYESIDEALERGVEMKKLGVDATLLNQKTGTIIQMDENLVRQITSIMDFDNKTSNRVTFRIQIGAFRNKLADHVFANLPNLLVFEGNDGLIRYTTGAFSSMQDAAKHRVDLLLDGFEGAFVVAYRSGRRITLQEAGATVSNPETDWQSQRNVQSSVNAKSVSFTIQIGSFSGRIPAEVLGQYLELGNVRPIRMPNGDSKYVYGKFEDQKQALDELVKIQEKGFKDAFVVGEFNQQVIPAADAERIKNQ